MNEERDELGELPPSSSGDLFEEHEGRFPDPRPGPAYQPGQQLPPDIAYQRGINRQVQGGDVNLGSPGAMPYNVQSVYDVLPINAKKFYKWDSGVFDIGITSGTNTVSISYTVPNGYIALLRKIKWKFRDPSISNYGVEFAEETEFQRLTINNTSVFDIDLNIIGYIGAGLNSEGSGVLPEFVDYELDVYALAKAQDIIKMEFFTPAIGSVITAGAVSATVLTMELFGDLLLDTGRPLPYEPGSRS